MKLNNNLIKNIKVFNGFKRKLNIYNILQIAYYFIKFNYLVII